MVGTSVVPNAKTAAPCFGSTRWLPVEKEHDLLEGKHTILVVDDEPAQRKLLGDFLRSNGFLVEEANSAEAMFELLVKQVPDMILLDVRLPGISGIEAIPKVRAISASVPITLITAYADIRQAVTAMKEGAEDYISKPVDLEELLVAIHDTLGIEHDESNIDRVELPELPIDFVYQSAAMRRLLETVAIVAPSAAPVLITGPSGTGKEWIARLIHAWSDRSDKPLVTANSAGLTETLAESELFGHTKGAFTGAAAARDGLFRSADGGSLFLDEIGEMPMTLQPKLLRTLETKEVTAVGSDKSVKVDTRIIAATNRDLAIEVEQGRFREDLYYRINVVELYVPPLAERRDDIVPLARFFANQFSGRSIRLSPRATQMLIMHSWPGNVRELRNAIQRACLSCRGDVILPDHFPDKLNRESLIANGSEHDTNRLSNIERAAILATLEECNGNRTHAAKKLGISRRSLIQKLRLWRESGEEPLEAP
ncbi:MAG: sigma-54-dependent Fis family transcriptional regulator [Planctomycetales bacterium]|nr:sigma-54-dependent Fis family transcriptional regulator [Planctomycetales bacterium]